MKMIRSAAQWLAALVVVATFGLYWAATWLCLRCLAGREAARTFRRIAVVGHDAALGVATGLYAGVDIYLRVDPSLLDIDPSPLTSEQLRALREHQLGGRGSEAPTIVMMPAPGQPLC